MTFDLVTLHLVSFSSVWLAPRSQLLGAFEDVCVAGDWHSVQLLSQVGAWLATGNGSRRRQYMLGMARERQAQNSSS
jgi:hypothetical protein